jgi:hypothetical protein
LKTVRHRPRPPRRSEPRCSRLSALNPSPDPPSAGPSPAKDMTALAMPAVVDPGGPRSTVRPGLVTCWLSLSLAGATPKFFPHELATPFLSP